LKILYFYYLVNQSVMFKTQNVYFYFNKMLKYVFLFLKKNIKFANQFFDNIH
jgi:hypothetical protein